MEFSTWPPVVVVDVEGNGASPPDLVEVATVAIYRGQIQGGQAVSTLIRPPRPVTWHATRVHGLTNEDLAASPVWPEVADQIRGRLGEVWIAAHNASVDYHALAAHLPGWSPAGVIDTLKLSRAAHPERGLRHRLDDALERVGIDTAGIPGERHRAGFDAHAAALLLLEFAGRYPTFTALAAAGALRLEPETADEEQGQLF
jgi:exodeoxyribonuclease X